MRIAIDGNEANVNKRVGISEYAFELTSTWYKKRLEKTIDHAFTIFLKNEPLDHMPKEKSYFKYKIIKPQKLWTQAPLPLYLLTHPNDYDVFFTPTHYAPRFSTIPRVTSVMDLSYEYYPQLFKKNDLHKLKNWTRYSVKKAKKVVTISNASRSDIIKFYDIQAEKIEVVYPGIKQNMMAKKDESTKQLQKLGINKKYILFVGTLQPRKNIAKLIEAFSKLEKKDQYQLIIVGKKGWHFDEILKAPEQHHVQKNTIFKYFVSDEELATLYKNCEVFVLPSLYEGFGLPVLEAMKQGAPVATSNISSLPEAGGDAALYFDPNNADDMRKTIEKILNDKSLQKKMKEKGKKQVQKFSWEKSATQVLKVLESV